MQTGRRHRSAAQLRIHRALGKVYPIDQLEQRFMLSGTPDLSLLQSNLNSAFTDANNVIQSTISATPLPLVGSKIGSEINTLTNLQSSFNSALGSITSSSTAAQVKTALQTALLGATVTIVQNSASVDEFKVSQNLLPAAVANSSSLSFNLGLPALGLSGSVGLNVSLGSVYTLDFGVSNTSGFFLSTTNTSFNFNTSISITSGSYLTGTFGPLAISASDYTGDPDGLSIGPTSLSANFTASLVAPGNASTLTTATLPSVSTNMTLAGNAHLALNASLQASSGMASSFPSLKSVLTLDWNFPSFALTSAGISGANFGNEPELGLHHLSVDLGSAINNILDPVLNDVYKVLKPIKPIVDFINGPMPLFNDVGFLKSVIGTNSAGVCTVGNFFAYLAGLEGDGTEAQSVVDFAQDVGDFYNLYNAVNGLSGATQGLDLGSFSLGGNSGDTLNVDLRNSSAVSNLDFSSIGMPSGVEGDIESYLDGIGGSDFASELFPSSPVASVPVTASFGNNNQYSFDNNTSDFGFHFPLLTNPGSAIGILFGQDVNLFTFTTPPMDIGVPFEVNIPVFGPLVICLRGNLDNNNDAVLFGGQFSMGYDTYGLTHSNLIQNPQGALDGFYINESDSFVAAGFGIAADAAVDLLIVEAGVGGGIQANVALGLNDPDSATDGGKLRYDQILTDLQNGPLGLFVFSGELTASLNAFVQIGWPPFGWEDSINFATITLLDFTTEAPAPVFATESNGVVSLDLNAANADTSGAESGLDNFTISDLGPDMTNGGEVIDINALGQDQILHGVTQITGEGGTQGFVLHVEPGVTAPVDIAGGYFPTDPNYKSTGNTVQVDDQGSGAATIYASDGNDNIRVAAVGNNASSGAVIYGGNVYAPNPGISKDVIETNGALLTGAENKIYGGTANQTITGGAGNDFIQVGNATTAVVDGGGGNNTIIGGTGNDHFVVNFADLANDTIQASASAASNLLQVNGVGGGETITAFYQSGALNVDSTVAGSNSSNASIVASNIQSLDIEPAPGLSTSSLAIPGQPAPTLPTPAAGPIYVDIGNLNGSGLTTLFNNILGSASGTSQVNPIHVNITGFGNDTVSVTGTYGSLNQSSSTVNNASEVYQITSSQAAGGLTIFTTDGPTDTLTYNAGTGANTFTLQNQIVNPGQITFNSLQGTSGTDTYNITAVVGATSIDQNGKNIAVNIGSSAPGGLSVIQSPVTIGGAIASSGSPNGYQGTIALTVTDATGTVGGTGTIDEGSISGFDLGSNTITWTFVTSLGVTLGNHGNTANVDLTGLETVTIQAGNGGDNIQASSSTTPMTLLGGTGNDTIADSSNGDCISGGAGNDFLTEGVSANHGGHDTIIGGNGSNHIIDDGGIGLIYGNDTTVDGSTGANLITGTATALIYTGPGQDTVTFTGGNDVTVFAGGGNDSISLGDGADSVSGAGGNDTITTGNGVDTITAGDGFDSVTVGYAADYLLLGNGNDTISAGGGLDTIVVGNGTDIITTGDGGDRITTGSGNSTITTGAGDDTILAGNGNNQISSGAGDDIIDIGTGSDVVNGGAGSNTLIQSANVNQVLTDNSLVSVGTATFSNIGQVSLSGQTSTHNFTVSGWTYPGTVELTGGSGNNTVTSTDDTNFTLTNSTLRRSDGTVFGLVGIQNAVLTGGSSSSTFDVSGWSGTATISGGGGLGVDTVVANDSSSMTLAAASLSRPGSGVVTLVNIVRAILTGDVGNLLLDASGFAGQATLVAGAGNDTLLAGTGGDYLSGGTGHDSLVSSSGRDVVVATSGAGDTINAGTGGDVVYSTNAADVINGTPASLNPSIPATGPAFSIPAASLPTGGDSTGPWAQFSGSASAGGVSNTTNTAIEPAVVAGSTAQYVAWADNRSGTYEIYVAEHVNGGSWQELAGSDHGGGISNSTGNSLRPSIALDSSGNPMVAWTTFNGTSSDIYAADYSGGSWVPLGTSITVTGTADDAQMVETSGGPVVTWLNTQAGLTNVRAKRYSAGAWSALGSGSVTGTGVTGSSTSVTSQALATDGTNIALAWTQPSGGSSCIYLLEFTGTAWVAVNGSTSGTGVSGSTGAAQPTVAFNGGNIYVAWQQTAGTAQTISAATNAGGTGWQALSTQALGTSVIPGSPANYGIGSNPQLAAGGGTLDLTWTQTGLAAAGAFSQVIEASQFNGSAFVDQIPGDDEIEGAGQSLSIISSLATAVDPSGHAFAVWGDSSSGVPQVYLRGSTGSVHNVYYVNGTYSGTDVFTTASGASGNTGLSPSSPLNSVQAVLSKYSLVSGDVIMVDSGSYAGFTLTTANAGISIIGAGGGGAHFTSAVTLTSASNVTLDGLCLDGGVSITTSSNIELRNSTAAGITVTGGTNVRLEQNQISATGITLTGGTSSPYVAGNTINASTGIAITGGGASSVNISSNTINAASGIVLSATSQGGTISGNNITSSGTGLNISNAFTGSITLNEIHGSAIGVNYNASAPLNANQIFGNTTGVTASVNSSSGGLGFVGTSTPNNIFQNTVGVQLTGLMQNQHIFGNTTGVTGSGTLGGTSLSLPNVIETNTTGVNFTGTIQYNSLDRNTLTMVVKSDQLIAHNLIFDNATNGLETSGASDVRIINNTFYSTSGDNVLLDNASGNVQLLDNIMESTGGYDLYVNADSRTGFFSDYNDLYTSATGKIVHWLTDFTDILNWQNALGLYDMHSIGSASINPAEGNPDLVAPANDDLQIIPFVNGIRSTSPATGTGDPALDIGLPASYTNLLLNPSFENGITSWNTSVGATTSSGNPAAFDGSSYFYAGGVASGFAEQTISLSGYASQIDSQTLSLEFGGRIRAGVETISSQGQIFLTFLNNSGGVMSAPVTLSATNVSNRWELVSARVNIPIGARSVEYEFTANRETGSADDSYLDNAFVYVTAITTAPDMGAYGYTATDVATAKATHLHLVSPDLYTNWVLNSPHTIQWQSYGNTGDAQIEIDLYQNGVFKTTIATVPDTGSYIWIPTGSQVAYGSYGLQIQISLVGTPAVYDRSTETFTVPENGTTWYINDGSTTGDQYTSVAGNDRVSGELASAPLPLLTTLFREYSLGGSNTVYIDNGTYQDFAPVEISSNPAIGNGSGITIIGPTNNGTAATIDADGFTSPAVIDVNDAGNVTLSHLALDNGNYGLWVHNASTGFSASYLTASGNLLSGIRIESDSSAGVTLDHLFISNNTGDGLYVGGVFASLTNSTSSSNTGDGFDLATAGGAVLTGDVAFGNAVGLSITNGYYNSSSTVGTSNLSSGAGNLFFNNTGDGIDANGPIVIEGNSVYNNSNGIGINLTSGASATENIVFGNKTGIETESGGLSVTYNRVYGNTGTGIEGDSGAILTGNLVYSNSVGIKSATQQGTGPTITNNLVYGNSTQGIWIQGGATGAVIDSNTVYQQAGDALFLDQDGGYGATNLHLDDNIFWTSGAFDIAINPLSEVGFTSDYNDLYVTGTGAVGQRENVSEGTLAAWQAAGGTDADSISLDPQFVNAVGGDFHPQSSTGSYHGGSLAPALNMSTGLPQANPGTPTAADANQSPTIDRGDPTAAYGNEPAPNGGVINLGSFGNTNQASLSMSSYVLVPQPTGGILLEGRTFIITWRSQDTMGLVNIDLLQNGSSTPVLSIASNVANSGSYSWSIPTSITPGNNFSIRVTRLTNSAFGISPAFTLDSAVHAFYVNGSAAGPATFAGGTFNVSAGSDSNSGLDPADAKATLQALLTEYTFVSGDVIYVDGGTYNLSSNVVLTAAADSGITIEGVTGGGTIFDRTNNNTGSYDFDLQGATNVTLRNLAITGGYYGVNASSGEGSTGLTVNASAFYGDYIAGIDLAAGNSGATIENSTFHDMAGNNGLTGIIVTNDDVTISGNILYNLNGYGINLSTGDNSIISGNQAYNDGTGIGEDTATVTGNIASHDSTGISAGGNTNVSGNTTYNDSTGISISGGIATGNVSYANTYGISVGSATASYNLLFNNSTAAITTGNGATILGNVAYGSGWGITFSSYPSGAVTGPIIENNLLYNNLSGGIDMSGGDTTPILNNTIYQAGGVGFEETYAGITGHGIAVRDNIIWNTAGPDVEVDATDETGFALDYNDLYATGTGYVGIWGSTTAITLAQWQTISSNDADSISTDPLFVNAAGGDFHLQSSSGSYHGGTLAPALNMSTGLPQANPGVPTNDPGYSPAIDAGSPTDPYANELPPNGGYVDLGAYGNSAQASHSKLHYLNVIRPLSGQTIVAGSATTITWRDEVSNTSTGPADTVDFAILLSGNTTPVQTFTGPDTGSYSWTPNANLSAGTYTVEITRTDGTGLNASSAAFNIAGQTHIYYVATTGSDSNSGTDPAHPKLTIGGVLSAGYTFHAGDTIQVAAGTYNISSNMALSNSASGIIITGVAGGGTILNRGTQGSGNYIFDLQGATNVTIENLALTDAYVAINTAYGTSSTGLTVTNCSFYNEQYIGIYLQGNNGTSTVTNSNFSGFVMINYGGSTGFYAYSHDTVTLMNDTSSGMSYGFYMQGIDAGTISGNTVYNNSYGISVSTSGVGVVNVSSNMAFDNETNLSVSGTDLTVSMNTVFKDSHASGSLVDSREIGISLGGNAVVTGNAVYNNATGISSNGGQFGAEVVSNNFVYNNSGNGISGGNGDLISGNDIYSNGGWGIQSSLGYGSAAKVTNNLIYNNSSGGIDFSGAYQDQVLNNTVYQTTGNAFELDGSPTANPNGLTVENNIFWVASTGAVGYAVQFSDASAYGFVSDFNDLYATANGQIAKEATQGFATLSAWAWELGQDVHSISADPQFVSLAGFNFNVSATSPTIDAGNPTSAYSLEPSSNGGRINLGYTGDTAQATTSAAQTVQILFPSGILKLQDGPGYTITWQSSGLAGGTTATVVLSVDGGNTWTTLATNVAMNSSGGGTLAWTSSVSTTGATGLIRVTASTGQVGISSEPFSLAGAGTAFYVSTTGNNANSGTSVLSPMSSIEAVLNTYHPGTGDTIYVAGGTYTLFHDIVIGPADTGITISGPTSGTAAVINRNNTGDFGFSLLDGANNITIENLSITGAYIGINAPSKQTLGNSNITILDNVLYSNGQTAYAGAIFTAYNSNWNISGNVIHDNLGFYGGIYLQGCTATIANNIVYNEGNYGIFFSTPVSGTTVAANVVSGNIVSFCATGIDVSQATVISNQVHDCTVAGIYVSNEAVATGNTVWRQTTTNAYGINVEDAFVSNNTVYDNYIGIYSGGGTGEIHDNHVYSNTDYGLYLSGLNGANSSLGPDYIATAYNNLVYANVVGGIYLTGDLDTTLLNNTVYQTTGNAITSSGTLNATYPLTFENNILYTLSGYDIDIPSSPAGGLISDYNILYHGTTTNSSGTSLGYWNGSAGMMLSTWQTISGQDSHSSEADPLFVDFKGEDATLGYNPSGNNGAGYNGGADDNFTLSAGSPAIDDGFSAGSPTTDLLGEPRVDDPGTANAGTLMTVITNTGSNQFNASSGVAQNWNGFNTFWTLTFPAGFTFPFYGTTYSSVNVSSNGFLEFNAENLGNNNSDSGLAKYPVIAPLWEYLTTSVISGDGSNIFVDTSVANQVTVRWKATIANQGTNPINFAVVLFSNGNIRFDYGAGNTGLAPTIGLSAGDGINNYYLPYDNAPTLTNANSILATILTHGYVDRGAYEFQGSSLGTPFPTVTAISPAAIGSSGNIVGAVPSITVTFSGPMDPIDALAAGEYELTGSNSSTYILTPQYTIGSNQVVLGITGGLPVGSYVFTILGTYPNGIHDSSGNLLNGNASTGMSYVRNFSVTAAQPVSLTGSPSYYLRLDSDGQHIDVWNSTTDAGGYSQQLTPSQISALTLTASGGAGTFTIDNSNGNVIPAIGVTLTGDGSTSLQIIGSGAGDTITANTGQIVFDGVLINFSGTTQATLNPFGGTDVLTVNAGRLLLAAPVAGSGLTVRRFSSITIGAGAELQVLTPASHSDRALLLPSALSIAGSAGNWTGTLDLGGNDLDVPNGVLSTLVNQLAAGYNGGLWNGTGVQSAAANSDTTHLSALGIIQNNQAGSPLFGTGTGQTLFDGINPGASDVLVKFTYYGDANLDGKVDGSDYSRIDSGFLTHLTGWLNGDFNYDGTVDGSDYTLIDNAFNTQGATQSGGPSYYLKLDADGQHVDIWNNSTGTGGYAQQVLESQTTLETLSATTGNGSFTIDNSAGKVFVTGGLSLVGNGSGTLKIIGTGGIDTVTTTASQIIFDGNPVTVSGINLTTLTGNINLPANALNISGGTTYQSMGTLNLLVAGNGSLAQAGINMSAGATLRLIGTANSAATPDIFFGPDSSGTAYYGAQIIGGTLDLGSIQRYIESDSGHNSVAKYLLPSYDVDSLITSSIVGTAGFNFQGNEEGTSGFYANLVLTGTSTFTGPIQVNLGSVYLYPGATGGNQILAGANQLILNNSSGAGTSYSHFFLLGGKTTVSNLTSIGTTPGNIAIANGNPDMGFAVGPATLTINQTINSSFGGAIDDTVTDNYDSGSNVPGSLSVAVTGTKNLTLTGTSAYTGTTTVGTSGSAPGLYLAPGAVLGDTAVTVSTGAAFGAGPGSHLGDINSNHSGGNLTINGGTLDMTAGGTATTIGTFAITQPAASANNSLTLSNATLDLDAMVSGADTIALTGPASVSGTNIVNITMLGTAAITPATYNLITATHGLTGTFEFANGTTTETIPYGSGTITLTLVNTPGAEELNIAQAPAASYYLKVDADGVHLDVWNNATGTGSFAQQVLRSQVNSLTLTASGGAGMFTVDNSASDVYVTGGLALVGDGSTALKIIGTGSGDTITANSGQIVFDGHSFSFSGTTTTTLDPKGGTDSLTVNSGKLMITAAPTGGGILARVFSNITIGAGAEVQVLTAASHSDRAILVVGGLTIAGSAGHWTGLLDLGGNDIDLQSGSLATLSNLTAAGYNFGGAAGWQPEGLSSSAALADTTYLTMLGVIQNNQGGSPLYGNGASVPLFDGISPGASDILIKYTYFGDTNLDGKVDGSDYSRIDNGYANRLTGWFNGDFNYDGSVNGTDYTLNDDAFNTQGASLA